MDATRKGRSTERPPSPEAPHGVRRPRRGRIAAGATFVAVGLAATTALAPAAADVLRTDTSTRSDATIAAQTGRDDGVRRSTMPTGVVGDLHDPRTEQADQTNRRSDRLEALQEYKEYRALEDYRQYKMEQHWQFQAYVVWSEQQKALEAQRAAEAAEAARAAEAERIAEQQAADAPAPAGGGGGGGRWDALAQCESGGNWSINTGNGYYGGLQFSLQTWRGFGGSGMPHENSRSAQIAVAERVLASQGWGAWPSCSSQLGYR